MFLFISGSNARLSYSFGEENDYFGINLQSGIVFVKNDLSPIGNQTIVLDTMATDYGTAPKSGRSKIKVRLYFFWGISSFSTTVLIKNLVVYHNLAYTAP